MTVPPTPADPPQHAPEAIGARGAGEGGPGWDPEGIELAKALVARAKAAGRPGRTPRQGKRKTSSRFTGRWRAPGAGWSGPADDDRDPQAVGAALDKLVGEHGWSEDLAVHGVIARWNEIVGMELALHVQPEGYSDSVLTVRADSTAWATQVKLLAGNLVRRLNQEIGDGTVTRVNVLAPQPPNWRKGRRSVPGRGPRDTYG